MIRQHGKSCRPVSGTDILGLALLCWLEPKIFSR